MTKEKISSSNKTEAYEKKLYASLSITSEVAMFPVTLSILKYAFAVAYWDSIEYTRRALLSKS